ncbi:MAG TPA: ABC transporter ATP-binding protein [Pirellulaceae bacterium]|nr:ABC transporter ATP-binding protein [Pirellulaceae bacterium]
MYVLETRNLRKTFGEGEAAVEALRGVDLGVVAGEMLAIMGRSGSGKSTLLTLLGGVDVPTSGQVLLEGRDVASMTDDERTIVRRKRIGFIFQSFNLLPILTAEENVSLPLELDGVSGPKARQAAIEKLDLVGLSARKHHIPGKLSGGEQQRVAIARALAIEPTFLLADEPTGNLDTANSQRVMALLRKLVDTHQQTMVLVTHDPAVAALADRVIHLSDGQIEREEVLRPKVTSNAEFGMRSAEWEKQPGIPQSAIRNPH